MTYEHATLYRELILPYTVPIELINKIIGK